MPDAQTLTIRRLLRDLVQVGLCLWLALQPLQLYAAPAPEEYKLKAALIYKLTKFIDWPAESAANIQSFGICLLGEDYFGDALESLENRKVNDKSIRVYQHTQSEAIDERCQIVFISDSKQTFIKPILQSLLERPILTLGDMDDFAASGGILQFTRGKKRIGFLINLESAKKSKLSIAAPLLDLATVVKTASH